MASPLMHVRTAGRAICLERVFHSRSAAVPPLLLAALVCALSPLPAAAQQVDEDAAVALAKKSNCFKCHAVDKRKKAPSYKEIAAKFKPRADAEAAIVKHLTESPSVKTEDGADERHETITGVDQSVLLNLVHWILSR